MSMAWKMSPTQVETIQSASASAERDAAKRFGKWLTARREEKGLSKARVVELSSMAHNVITKVEQGHYITRATVSRMAMAIGVDVDEALMQAGWMPLNPDRVAVIHEVMRTSLFKALAPSLKETFTIMGTLTYNEQSALAGMIREYSGLLIHKRKGAPMYERS